MSRNEGKRGKTHQGWERRAVPPPCVPVCQGDTRLGWELCICAWSCLCICTWSCLWICAWSCLWICSWRFLPSALAHGAAFPDFPAFFPVSFLLYVPVIEPWACSWLWVWWLAWFHVPHSVLCHTQFCATLSVPCATSATIPPLPQWLMHYRISAIFQTLPNPAVFCCPLCHLCR